MGDELSALLATLLLLLGHRAETVQPERFAAAVWAESQHAPRPPYEWARLMVAIAENESRLSQRIADGKCRPIECDRGRAKGMWQLHRNTLNRDSWGKQDGDVELQAHLASEQLKRAYWQRQVRAALACGHHQRIRWKALRRHVVAWSSIAVSYLQEITMIEFDEAFPEMKDCDCSRSDWDRNRLDYHQIASKLGEEVVLYESDDDYQGSTYSLLRHGTRYGYLEFGWGSCSGCDAAEAAESYKDWKDLFESLRDGVQWFDTLQGFLSWANQRDWKGQWSWHDGVRKFLAAVNAKYETEIAVD